jgi:hypothetical protein
MTITITNATLSNCTFNISKSWFDFTKDEVYAAANSWSSTGNISWTSQIVSNSTSQQFVNWLLAPNGKFYGIPNFATTIGIFDPITSAFTTNTMGTSLPAGAKYRVGVLAPNGKIYCAPLDASNVLVINTNNDTAITTTFGVTFTGSNQYTWGCLGADNKIYFGGGTRPNILIIDYITETATTSNFGSNANVTNTTAYKNIGAVRSLVDDKIYCAPYNIAAWLILDTATQTITTSTFGLSVPGFASQGIINSQLGRLATGPYAGGTSWRIVNLPANTANAITQSGYQNTGLVTGPDGRTYILPAESGGSGVAIYNPQTGTTSVNTTGGTNPVNVGVYAMGLAGNGKGYWFPQLSGSQPLYTVTIPGTGTSDTNLQNYMLTPYFNVCA